MAAASVGVKSTNSKPQSLVNMYTNLASATNPSDRKQLAHDIVDRESQIISNSVYDIKTDEDTLPSVVRAKSIFDKIISVCNGGKNGWPGYTAATTMLTSNYRSLYPRMTKDGVFVEKMGDGFVHLFAPISDRGWSFHSTSKELIEKLFRLRHIHTTSKDKYGWFSELYEVLQ